MSSVGCPVPSCRTRRANSAVIIAHVKEEHTFEEVAAELIELIAVAKIVALVAAPRRVCEKIGYPTAEAADIALRSALLNRNPRRHEIRHYECPECGYRHLTSKPTLTADKMQAARTYWSRA